MQVRQNDTFTDSVRSVEHLCQRAHAHAHARIHASVSSRVYVFLANVASMAAGGNVDGALTSGLGAVNPQLGAAVGLMNVSKCA